MKKFPFAFVGLALLHTTALAQSLPNPAYIPGWNNRGNLPLLSNNLSDLPNKVTARNNLGISSISVRDYSDMQTAANAAIGSGKSLYFPCGTYLPSGGVTVPTGAAWIGEAPGCVGIQTSAATGDVLTMNGFNYLRNIGFSYSGGPSTQRTSGAYIKVASGAGPVDIGDVYFRDGCEDTHWLGGSVSYLRNAVSSRGGNGCSANVVDGGIALHISSMTTGAASTSQTSAVRVLNAEVNCIDCLLQGAVDDVLINPTSGVGYFHAINSYFDQAVSHAVNIVPGTGGAVQRVALTNSWAVSASGGSHSINAAPTGSATVSGVTINQIHLPGFANGSVSDIYLGTNVSNIQLSGIQAGGSTSGMAGITCDGCQKLNISNAITGNVEAFGALSFGVAIKGAAKYVNIHNLQTISNNIGITISDTADYVTINGSLSDSNTTNYFCSSSGTHFRFSGNIGIPDKNGAC